MEIDLAPVGSVHAGELHYPSARLEQVAERYTQWAEETPSQLTASLILGPAATGHGSTGSGDRPSIVVRGCHLGAEDDAELSLDYWRRWRTPDVDRWITTTFGAFVGAGDHSVVWPTPSVTYWLTEMDTELLARLAGLVSGPDGGPRIETVQIIDLGPRFEARRAAAGRAVSRWCLLLSGRADEPTGVNGLRRRLDDVAARLPVLRPDTATRRRLRRVRHDYGDVEIE